nr:hypothetical protein CFP56_26823 [Quercus suber]
MKRRRRAKVDDEEAKIDDGEADIDDEQDRQRIVEVFNRVTLENVHAASEMSTRATGNGGRGGGCQGRGCHGGCRASRVHTPKLEHANEDEDELVIEELKDEGACDTYVDGVGTP